MTNRTKKQFDELLPVQQRIIKALEKLDRSIRWLAQRLDLSYPMIWQKIWVNEKIDTNTVEQISRVLQLENKDFSLDYFMPPSAIHFSMPGHISKDQSERIKLLADKLNEVSKSPEDTELVLTLVDKILGSKK